MTLLSTFAFYDMCFKEKNPTVSAYSQSPKFLRAKYSATAIGENCTYGPTLLHKIFWMKGKQKMTLRTPVTLIQAFPSYCWPFAMQAKNGQFDEQAAEECCVVDQGNVQKWRPTFFGHFWPTHPPFYSSPWIFAVFRNLVREKWLTRKKSGFML